MSEMISPAGPSATASNLQSQIRAVRTNCSGRTPRPRRLIRCCAQNNCALDARRRGLLVYQPVV